MACAAIWVLLLARYPLRLDAFYKGYLSAWLFLLGVSLGAFLSLATATTKNIRAVIEIV